MSGVNSLPWEAPFSVILYVIRPDFVEMGVNRTSSYLMAETEGLVVGAFKEAATAKVTVQDLGRNISVLALVHHGV